MEASSSLMMEKLSKILVRRKISETKSCFVYLPTGEPIKDKKKAMKALERDENLFNDLQDSCKQPNETEGAFYARVLKLLVTVPFEEVFQSDDDEAEDGGNQKSVTLSKLIARRKVEGGDFSYVYIPLDKVINIREVMFLFLKNQGEEYSALKRSCQEDGEADDAFENRMMAEMLFVPFEKEAWADMVDSSEEEIELPEPVRPEDLKQFTFEGKKGKSVKTSTKSTVPPAKSKPAAAPFLGKKSIIDCKPNEIKYIYFETESLYTETKKNKAIRDMHFLTQLGAINEDQNKFFSSMLDDSVRKADTSVTQKLNLIKKDNFGQTNHVFNGSKSEIACSKVLPGLEKFITHLLPYKAHSSKACIVTYRKESLQSLFTLLDRHSLRKAGKKKELNRLEDLIDHVVVLEDVFKESLEQYLPMGSLGDLYSKTLGFDFKLEKPSCEDLAEMLMECCNILMDKHGFALIDFAVTLKSLNEWKPWKELLEDGPNKMDMPEGKFSVINSLSFVKKEKFKDSSSKPNKTVGKENIRGLMTGPVSFGSFRGPGMRMGGGHMMGQLGGLDADYMGYHGGPGGGVTMPSYRYGYPMPRRDLARGSFRGGYGYGMGMTTAPMKPPKGCWSH